MDEFVREPTSELRTYTRFVEGTSRVSHSVGSASSRSDCSEHEPISRTHVPSLRNLSSRCFISKPVHPLSFPDYTVEGDGIRCSFAIPNFNKTQHSDLKFMQACMKLQSPGLLDIGATPQRETAEWSSASSMDFSDVSEALETEWLGLPYKNLYEGSKCILCERFLSQRSPWASRRIVRSGDMPIASVLSCWHVYHAECLERITPKTQRHDPPCPLCEKSPENVLEQWAVCRLKNGFPRLRSLGEEGSSRIWKCGQVRDCVEGVIHAPKQANMSSLCHSRLKRHLSMKGTRRGAS